MSEERLTELLHRLTPEPPNSIDLPRMAQQIVDDEDLHTTIRPRRRLLPALLAAAAIAAIAVAAVTVVSHRASDVGPAGGGNAPKPTGQEMQRAKDVLDRWDQAVSDSPTGHPTVGPLPEKGQSNMPVDSAAISADRQTLTVRFPGAPEPGSRPCGADYAAFAVESDKAVAVIVTTKPHGKNEMCNGAGAERNAVVQLKQPLADRTVLETSRGLPVKVTG
jgi:hypothetical protein